MLQWILANEWWLIPTVLIAGNEVVKLIPGEKDNDIWKAISYVISRIFMTKNKSKGLKSEHQIYTSGEKPEFIERLDRFLFDPYQNRIQKILQNFKK
jgi:hypothetical protein